MTGQAGLQEHDAGILRGEAHSGNEAAKRIDFRPGHAHASLEEERAGEASRLLTVFLASLGRVDAFESQADMQALSVAHDFQGVAIDDGDDPSVEWPANQVP